MKTDAQVGIFTRERDRFASCVFINHQTGTCKDSLLMRCDDRAIDGSRATEIIGIDDQTPGHENKGVSDDAIIRKESTSGGPIPRARDQKCLLCPIQTSLLVIENVESAHLELAQ